jgi:CrcB protein
MNFSLLNLLIVAVGGALGSVARYLVSVIVSSFVPSSVPSLFGVTGLGTLIVNSVGSLLIGIMAVLLSSLGEGVKESVRLLAVVGFLGGFTTFSAFSLESLLVLQGGDLSKVLPQFIWHIVFQVVMPLLAVAIGFGLGRIILK